MWSCIGKFHKLNFSDPYLFIYFSQQNIRFYKFKYSNITIWSRIVSLVTAFFYIWGTFSLFFNILIYKSYRKLNAVVILANKCTQI